MNGTQALLDSIAYVAWHGQRLHVEEPGRVVVAQPDRPDLHNYVGTVHAGAIYTLAETAAGVAADGVARPLGGIILLGTAEVRYRRRAEGALEAEARLDPHTDQAALTRAFAADGRASLAVVVAVRDRGGAAVFEGTFHYALRRRNP